MSVLGMGGGERAAQRACWTSAKAAIVGQQQQQQRQQQQREHGNATATMGRTTKTYRYPSLASFDGGDSNGSDGVVVAGNKGKKLETLYPLYTAAQRRFRAGATIR